ncbi:MAG: host attachment family protein [Paracoccaceae bacterium]|nr:host attachment family protein [Paracoccaceae bacterium]
MALLAKGIWVVVADGEKVIILENVGDTRKPDLHQIEHLEAAAFVVASDRPGRMADPGPKQRSAMEQPDFARLAAENMVRDLVGRLGRHVTSGACTQLVLAAPPQVLGAIRAAMDPGLRAHVLAELPKTLTKHPLPKIADLIAEALDAV